MDDRKLYAILTYAGALPFIGCALLLLSGYQEIPTMGSLENILLSYALVIVSFLCGIHWGLIITQKTKSPLNLLITSVVITVAAWEFYLLKLSVISLMFFILAFVILLAIDYKLYSAKLLKEHYFKTRLKITIVVVVSLLISAGTL